MDVIALVGGAGNFVDLLGELAAGMQAQARAQFRDVVRRDLRAIRFGAPGVLDQLKRMRDGTRVQEYEWRPVLQAFNDDGWAVDPSLQRVAAAVEQAGLPLALADSNFLLLVRKQKLELLRTMQGELNYLPKEDDAALGQARARQLIEAIEAFNDKVETLDRVLAA
ncbi:MAG: hypothetical protein SGI91_11345 [Alphaproteobacteria bacterium]|jgi:hypothetical protein|nr:hypothetical protein [Alphaproteobacteria bacterium]